MTLVAGLFASAPKENAGFAKLVAGKTGAAEVAEVADAPPKTLVVAAAAGAANPENVGDFAAAVLEFPPPKENMDGTEDVVVVAPTEEEGVAVAVPKL